MKNQQGIVWAPVLIMIGVVVLAGIAVYMLIQAGNTNQTETNNSNVAVVDQVNNSGSANTNTSVNTNATSNTNSAVDVTAGWKTYENKTYNISFQYPPDWKVQEGEETTPYKIDVIPPSSLGGNITFWIGSSYSIRCGESPKTSTSEATIGGIPATLTTVVDQETADCKFRNYYLSRTPAGWTKPTNGADNTIQVMATKAGSYATQDAILATLKLTDPTAGWKTYTNKTYGWSVKYPSTWQPVLDDDETPDAELVFNGATGSQKITTVRRPDPVWTDDLNIWLSRVPDVSTRVVHDITVNGIPAKWVETNVYDNWSYIGFRKEDIFVNMYSSNAEMVTNGMLSTFTFID